MISLYQIAFFSLFFQTIQEAQCLANQVEVYYCNPSQEKLALMETFTKTPDKFKHADLIAQMDAVNLLTDKKDEASSSASAAAKK